MSGQNAEARRIALLEPGKDVSEQRPPESPPPERPKHRLNVSSKLFLALFLVLTLNLIVVSTFGSVMTQSFYRSSKEKGLQTCAAAI